MKRGISMLILGLAAGAASLTAHAVQAQCVIFDPVVLSGSFDPFNPSGTTVQTLTITARRPPAVGGKKTQEVDFIYLRRPDTPASLAVVQTSTGGQILENPPGHVLDPNNTNPNEVELNFGGVGQPDVKTFAVTITVPSGADLAAGTTDLFVDQKYYCKRTGGAADESGVVPNSLDIRINVLSALQASFVGPALDFGEIGALTTAALPSTPNSVKQRTGNVRVASSGPYSVALTSANQFRMTYPGGNLATANQRIPYQLDFLGQTRSNASPTFSTVTCQRAGLGGQYLAITPTLLEGGAGKAPAPNYQDILTVTVTPLAVPPATTPVACM
jgi:spore coat protein U-like protein